MYGVFSTNATTTGITTYATGAWPDNSGWHDPWNAWNQQRTWSTTSSTTIWAEWGNTYFTTTTNGVNFNRLTGRVWPVDQVVPQNPVQLNPQPPEEHWNDIRARQEAARIDREANGVFAAARVEATKLLGMVLDGAQMADYAAKRHFDVVGSEGGVYRIFHGTSGNIRQLVDGEIVNRLCVHPRLRDDDGGYLPTEDCLAAQALALMHDERGAVNRANVHSGRRHLAAA